MKVVARGSNHPPMATQTFTHDFSNFLIYHIKIFYTFAAEIKNKINNKTNHERT